LIETARRSCSTVSVFNSVIVLRIGYIAPTLRVKIRPPHFSPNRRERLTDP
jgi:hypothetical protein